MPNPDFEGSVPRMRCETCEHWERWFDDEPFGVCGRSRVALTNGTVTEILRNAFPTTDLTVCSNWKKKDE